MRPVAIMTAVVLLTGCHTVRVGSPQFQRAPELICIVVVEPDNEQVAQAAINACRKAIEEEEREKKL